MKKIIALFILICILTLSFYSCAPAEPVNETILVPDGSAGEPVNVSFAKTNEDMFTDRDLNTDYDASSAISVTLNGDGASSDSKSVRINGSNVTLTSENTYVISGNLDDGKIIVNADSTDKVHIILNGVNISSFSSAALYVMQADKVIITLPDGTNNVLSNKGRFTAIDSTNIDGVIFSKDDISFNGNGSLSIDSPAGHGIVSKDDVTITGGTYKISSSMHAISANDSIRLTGSPALQLTSGKDGLHAENAEDKNLGFIYVSDGSFTIDSTGDSISASSNIQIENGCFNLTAGGGKGNTPIDSTSFKSIKSGQSILISNGEFQLNSADDAIHSDSCVIINGGIINANVTDDAIHAESDIQITNGRITVEDSGEGLESHNITLSGGTTIIKSIKDGVSAFPIDENDTSASVNINGGSLYIKSGDDGIDSKGAVNIRGGYTAINVIAQEKSKGINYVTSSVISGGIFICTGSESQVFSESSQGLLKCNSGAQTKDSLICVVDSKGATVLKHTPALDYSTIIVSAPTIKQHDNCKIQVNSKTFDLSAS